MKDLKKSISLDQLWTNNLFVQNLTNSKKKFLSTSNISFKSVKKLSKTSSFNSHNIIEKSSNFFYFEPLLTKDARSRNFIVGSLSHQSSLFSNEELKKCFLNSSLNIVIITWNMCGKQAKSSTLANLLLPDNLNYLPDIFVVGIQEAPYSSNKEKRDWEIQLQSIIGIEHVVLHSINLGVLHLIIFVRRHLIWFTSKPEHSFVNSKNNATNLIKTKGAVGISFKVFGTSLLFINSHFSAHSNRNKQRIEEYSKICTLLNLPKSYKTLPIKYLSKDVTNRFDYVFWFGDLNFRIELKQEEMIEKLENINNFTSLLENDQLIKAMGKKEIFSNFKEENIKFKPTFKYIIGTNKYDNLVKRVPSWTDRILYKVKGTKNQIDCFEYNSVNELNTSDHKPVFCNMNLKLKPGKDTDINLNAGLFKREIYLEGIKKRRDLWSEIKKKKIEKKKNCILS